LAKQNFEKYLGFSGKLEKALNHHRFKKYAGKAPRVTSPLLFDLQERNSKKAKQTYATISQLHCKSTDSEEDRHVVRIMTSCGTNRPRSDMAATISRPKTATNFTKRED
jgi:hypothetical protein